MLYELIGIVRTNGSKLAEVKEIVLSTGQTILRGGGVIRDVANWGVFSLPRSVTSAQMRHHQGHYFVVRYDASAATQEAVNNALKLEPRVIRSSSVKLGDGKLETLGRLSKVPWPAAPPKNV